ncbi:hypothetical protein F5B22DRAFT_646045 [Xylaria bambusicola]|uniref:uncharacterized protein n=1 Tax=Xylaria bambusicola TaxID=326684 RepID=UPI002007BBC2|nr:uncharacterized protein F5B22DRAFT_646045 [Xylaria bambusicola]KAI0517407.1 hypothetical protein F5B22DRAFT_646045 [Xylaria bambusicola]
MPAFVDWNSLLFGSSPEIEPRHQQKGASNPGRDASHSGHPESKNAFHENEIPEDIVPQFINSEHSIPETVVPETVGSHITALPGAAHLGAILDSAKNDQFTIAAIVLGSLFLWLLFGRRKRVPAPTAPTTPTTLPQPLGDQEEILDAIKKDFAQRTEALEKQHDQALKQQLTALEERFQKVLSEQSEAIEEHVRKIFNKRAEELEVRIKLDQEALNDVHRALSERMEAFEGFVQTIDAKQLDQEANSIAQLTLGQRLDTVEEGLKNVDAKARASSQRIEAIDDSVRVIDSRAKALSQRLEAAEDNLNTADGQVTLLSHDVNRGSSVIEKLQRQVKMLPDSDKFKGLSRTWEAKLKKLEAKVEETEKALEEHLTEPPSILTWSQIESVEIEPSGPLYTRPYSQSFDGSVVSPSSSSVRSASTSDSHTRTYSTVSSSPAPVPLTPMSPMTPERKRIDSVGFRDTTFSSRQKFLASRTESWSG